MSVFILCPSCSENLGEVCMFVEYAEKSLLKEIHAKKFTGQAIDKLDINFKLQLVIGFILDAAGIKLPCCRQHLLGAKYNEMILFA